MRNPKWHRDEVILALNLYFDEERGGIDRNNPKIIALSNILRKLPLFDVRVDNNLFRNPNGVSLKLSNFLALDPAYHGSGMSSYSRLDKEVFEEFVNDREKLKRIAAEIKRVVTDEQLRGKVFQIEDDDSYELDSVREGQVIYKLHKVRERNQEIVQTKKKLVLKSCKRLKCELCGFDFAEAYGDLGKGFIECHHLIPLSNYSEDNITKVEDLALLCANCHRMIHRDLNVTSIDEFRQKWNVKYKDS